MQPTTTTPPDRAHPTVPPPVRTGTPVPPNLARVLHVVRILLAYGRHLADTFERRSAAPGFHLIAKAFGTDRAAVILAHIRRGILRAAALERLLLRRLATGRDLTLPPVRLRTPRAPQPAEATPAATTADAPQAPKPPPRASWRDDWLDDVADPLDPRHLPAAEALEAGMRRRPIGRSIGDICADLGIAPSLCAGRFWDDLFMVLLDFDGNPATCDVRRWRRETEFENQQDRHPTMDLSWPDLEIGSNRGHIRRVLGFLIGEDPVEPPLIQPSPDQPSARSAWVAPAVVPTATGPP